jgi:hypothetical protein
MLKIERNSDSRVIKAILHRIADIPGGVTVNVSDLGGAVLVEGTPLAVGSNGMYNVLKTGKVVTEYVNGTSLEIAKGHHFKVGDKIANEAATMTATITAIDKTTNAAKDVVTLAAQFSAGMAVNAKIILVTTVTDATHTGAAYAQAENNTPTVLVKKGHGLVVGDYIKGATMTGKLISDINRFSSELYDTITLAANTGAVVAANEALTAVTAGNGTTVQNYTVITKQTGTAVAIVGNNEDVAASTNLFVPAWLIAVVDESNGPVVTDTIKAQLSGIKYL